MNNQYKLKVKVNNNDDTRLWRYSEPNDFDGLCSFITTTWQITDYIAQYEDDEGDFITIASAQDLKDAFDFAVEEKKKSLKIFIQPKVGRSPKKPVVDEPAQQSPPPPPKAEVQFTSVRDMVIDFLSNGEICALLPEMFGVLVENLTKKGSNLKAEDIAAMISSEMNDNTRFAVITSHPLYQKYSGLAIPFISHKIALQQSLYPHFRMETIKSWITQLIGMLSQAFTQRSTAIEDVVIDLVYPPMTDDGKVIHFGVECDLCGQYPIIGDRYKCTICGDWDCCVACEPKHDHPLIKFKKSRNVHCNASFKGLAEMFKCLAIPVAEETKEDIEEVIIEEVILEEGQILEYSECDCICGSKMECMEAKKAYGNSNTVYCDICNVHLLDEMVYHCPKEKDAVHHANGYDLCAKCGVAKSKKEEAMKEMTEEEDIVVIPEVEPEEEPEPEVLPEVLPEEVFEYAQQLVQIKQIMALEDDSDGLIKVLLIEHKGDIARVVPLLLDQ